MRESEERFKAQYKGIPVPTYTWQRVGEDLVLRNYNDAGKTITRGRIVDFLGKTAREMYQDEPEIQDDFWRCIHEKTNIKRKMLYRFRSTGESKYFVITYVFVPPDLVMVHTEDITERNRAEEELKSSLKEKEVLLQEIHHRVKNNLQVISCLLDMSSLRTHDQQAINLLTDARARIHIMSIIHAQLYQGKRFDQIDMGSHIRELVGYLSAVYAERKRITPRVEVPDVYLSLTQAIPCALVLSELISNAFKHAFKEGQEGILEITMQQLAGDTIVLRVKDDGIGIRDDIDIYQTNTLGLKLVRRLVQRQLKGEIQVIRDPGTEFIITFKICNG